MPVFCDLFWVLLQKLLTKAKKQKNSPQKSHACRIFLGRRHYFRQWWAVHTKALGLACLELCLSAAWHCKKLSAWGLSQAGLFFLRKKWPSCFREQGWEQMTLLHPRCEQGRAFHWTTRALEDKLQGDRRGGREAALLTAGELPPSAGWTCSQKKKKLRQEGTEVFGYKTETTLPRRALRTQPGFSPSHWEVAQETLPLPGPPS